MGPSGRRLTAMVWPLGVGAVRIDTCIDSRYSRGMNTKYIARITGLPVAHINSAARDLDTIIAEVAAARQTERGTRYDDRRSDTAMEDRKRQGYF